MYCARKEVNDSKIIITNVSEEEACEIELEMPSIELIGNNPLYVEINEEYVDPGYIAKNIDGSEATNVTVMGEVNVGVIGNYIITYTVIDDGKFITIERTVVVRDTIPPILTIPGNITILVNEVSNFDLMEGVSATDNSGELPVVTLSGNLSIIPGTYEIAYTAKDSSGNTTILTRYITVQDIEAPIITIIGDNPYNIYVGSVYIEAGATATDDVDGDLTDSIVITGLVNPNVPGAYEITYTVTDSSNNITTVIRTVNVIDNVSPVVAFGTNGNSTWSKSHSTTVTVTDLHSNVNTSSLRYLVTTASSGVTENQITTAFTNSGTVTINAVTGEYYLWILAKDTAGNTVIVRSNVFKLDNTGPSIVNVVSNVSNITKNSFTITRSGNAEDNQSGLATNPYVYEISTNGTSWQEKCTSNSTTCNVTGLTPETTYYYRICAVDILSNKSCISSKTVATASAIYTDGTGAPAPALSSGMIPIKWDSTNETWVKADIEQEWYDYSKKEWANVVLVKTNTRSMYQSAAPGTVINEDDVLAYLVWIPRYRYQLFNVEAAVVPEQTINIAFESKTTPKSTGTQNGEWLTHPAFTFGNKELSGFWVGKFETSTDGACYSNQTNSSCNNPNQTSYIKQGRYSLVYQNVYHKFITAQKFNDSMYGLTSANDAHMMKNTEWGAVAYLSHSIYGKNGQVYINNVNPPIAGYGGAEPDAADAYYSYAYTTSIGQQASTTGNVYGIYDMSGGAREYVMGHNSGVLGYSGFSSLPDLKYINIYQSGTTFNDQNAYNRRILGDATGETRGWYNDDAIFVFSDPNYSWFLRGGHSSSRHTAGIFSFDTRSGNSNVFDTFRVVILGTDN